MCTVGDTKRRVACGVARLETDDAVYRRVDGIVEQDDTAREVVTDDLLDLDAIDTVGLDGMVVVPLDVYLAHLDVGRPWRIASAVDTDAVARDARDANVTETDVRTTREPDTHRRGPDDEERLHLDVF